MSALMVCLIGFYYDDSTFKERELHKVCNSFGQMEGHAERRCFSILLSTWVAFCNFVRNRWSGDDRSLYRQGIFDGILRSGSTQDRGDASRDVPTSEGRCSHSGEQRDEAINETFHRLVSLSDYRCYRSNYKTAARAGVVARVLAIELEGLLPWCRSPIILAHDENFVAGV